MKKAKSQPKVIETRADAQPPVDSVISLADEELTNLRDFDRRLAELKSQLADIYLQKQVFDDSLAKITTDISTLRDSYIASAKELAKSHGADIDKGGNWTIDLNTKTLTKKA